MKAINGGILIVLMFAALSCSKKSETDSTEISSNQNEEKFDSTEIKADAEFVVKAVDGGMLEVKLGELAQSNGSSPDVKNFGKQMVTDHTKAGEELKALANTKKISFPGTLSDKNLESYNDLAKKTGAAFDKDYAEFMVKDHKEDIEHFEKEAEKGNDPELKSWAAGILPTLKHHLMMAEEAEKIVKKK